MRGAAILILLTIAVPSGAGQGTASMTLSFAQPVAPVSPGHTLFVNGTLTYRGDTAAYAAAGGVPVSYKVEGPEWAVVTVNPTTDTIPFQPTGDAQRQVHVTITPNGSLVNRAGSMIGQVNVTATRPASGATPEITAIASIAFTVLTPERGATNATGWLDAKRETPTPAALVVVALAAIALVKQGAVTRAARPRPDRRR